MDSSQASNRVQGIIAAAEQAAQELRKHAEERAAERIAEADRAAINRVKAAEEEAGEILQKAQAEAEHLLREAREQVGTLLEGGAEELTRQRTEEVRKGQEKTRQLHTHAREEAREIVSDAYGVAHEIQREGSEIAGNLRDLSASLRNNAERLLRDVRLAHGSMTARLDQAAPGGGATRRSAHGGEADAEGELEVPEFMPGE
jgi:vacuolar-type H+-ATPase subunit H